MEKALQAEEEKVKNLYNIETELNNITVVVNAGKDIVAKLETTRVEKEKELELKISDLEEEYANKLKELESKFADEEKKLKIERIREVEEYNYNIKREREISNNNWLDEKKKREIELSLKEEELNKVLQEKLDKAYAEIKDMATKIVEANGNVKILNNNQESKQ